MRRNSWFWGLVFILAGLVFLLDNLGFFQGINVWNLIWPLFLIALGAWTLWGTVFRRSPESQHAQIPLEGASRARVKVAHGAGRLRIDGGAGADLLADGDFGGGLDLDTRREGDLLDVSLRVPVPSSPIFWWPGTNLDWSFRLNREIPLSLEMDTGANDAIINLGDLRVGDVYVKSGASSTNLTLPSSAGNTRVRVETGVSSFNIHVPEEVAARIRVRGGLSSLSVDQRRFPKVADGYQSPDYETAQNRADIDVQLGVGSVSIH